MGAQSLIPMLLGPQGGGDQPQLPDIPPSKVTLDPNAGQSPAGARQSKVAQIMNAMQGMLSAPGRGDSPLEVQKAQMMHDVQMQQLQAEKAYRMAQIMAENRRIANEETRTKQMGAYETGELGVRGREAASKEKEVQQTGEYQKGELATRSRQADIEEQARKETARHDVAQEGLEGRRITEEAASRRLQIQSNKELREEMMQLTQGRFDKAQAEKIYQPALDSNERLTIMKQNEIDGNKGDQQADISMIANHIGMTLGMQKGARITQTVWNEAMQSDPLLRRVGARFEGGEIRLGAVLTPEQRRQMVSLAEQRYKQDLQKARSMGGTIGVSGYEPQSLSAPVGGDQQSQQGGATHVWTPEGLKPLGQPK